MSRELIGKAEKLPYTSGGHEGISFFLDYGESVYDILLTDQEMDTLLLRGFQRILENKSVPHYSHHLELQDHDLPLLIGPKSIETHTEKAFRQNVTLSVSVVTLSGKDEYEHRGVLLAERDGFEGEWSLKNYQKQGPLTDMDNG